MATMLPAHIPPDTKSPGERDVFEWLRDTPGTEDWTVLHSLDLAEHVSRPFGEADFVVVVPGEGLVVLEVKGVRRLRREGGLWYYGADRTGRTRSPFAQARDAMHSLRTSLTRRLGDISKVTFTILVVLPYVDLDEDSPEWHDWEVADRRSLRARSLVDHIRATFKHQREQLSAARTGTSDDEKYRQIVGSLRPDFEVHETPRARVQRLDDEVLRYTEEQYAALDAMSANDRVIFDAPAGAGKTVLATEAARRAATSGERVLFTCFNRALGRKLHRDMSGQDPPVTAGTIHSWMLTVSGARPTNAPDFWDRELPERTLEALMDGRSAPFDRVVIDEGQDFSSPALLDVLEFAIEGGLADGRWYAFGDFTNQSLLDGENPESSNLRDRAPGMSVYRLTKNCRNTPRIASLAGLVGRLRLGYGVVLRTDDLVEPSWNFYSNEDEQLRLLMEEVERCTNEGFAAADIAVLSFRREGVAKRIAQWPARHADDLDGRSAVLSTIHSFKGLEAGAVILTDLERLTSPLHRNLLYVGATRARHRLTILAHEQARPDLREALVG